MIPRATEGMAEQLGRNQVKEAGERGSPPSQSLEPMLSVPMGSMGGEPAEARWGFPRTTPRPRTGSFPPYQ
jgi:hypothetical protein